ncbi:MAG: 3-hydroxybutyryl-CoA dehydrogenase [Alphaproteobacteria bacterium]|nr:3-hydroxybutyryl-CoA dehydrogenase [Alphaproteobacteria bacterium]
MISIVGIVGAGQMGRGIAEACAVANKSVILVDRDAASLGKSQHIIQRNLKRVVESARMTQEAADRALGKITYAQDIATIAPAQLLIEAVSEDETTKKAVLKATQAHLSKDALVASNTSSISITRLAIAIRAPERFIGLHFMNPVPKMKLVEMIRGLQTSDETFAVAQEFIVSLDKTIAMSEDFPAFIVNRILIPMINEAILALYEGVGNVENIDTAMKLGANHPLGPLELADYIGLDTVLAILHVLYEGLADPKYRPCPLLNRYVAAGWLGKKTGRGFYDYSGETPVPTR